MTVELDSTQNALKLVFNLMQWSFLMPLENSNFRWSSWKTLGSLVLTVVSLVEALMFANYLLKQDDKFAASSGLVFYLTVLGYKVLFLDVARKWPLLVKKWDEVDFSMLNYVVVDNYQSKIRKVCVSLFALALAEHLFFTASLHIFFSDLPILQQLEVYFEALFQFVFMIVPYNLFFALILQVFNWLWTIIWNIVDVLLISLFMCFTFRLKQIEKRVATMIEHKVRDVSYWMQTREHFVKLTELCLMMESCISRLVLLSFANKLYVLLYQFLGLMSGGKSNRIISQIYYAFSFFYILLRLAAIIFSASAIDGKNNDIICKLFSAPEDVYNVEIDRFITALRVTPPSISGAKFFEVKKPLLLKIASTIIIYELMIIGFKKNAL